MPKPAPKKPAAKKKSSAAAVGTSANAISYSDDLARGVRSQSSALGKSLQKGSSFAGKHLPSAGSLARNPIVRGLGKYAGPAAFVVEGAGNYLEGDGWRRNGLETVGGAAGGFAGASLGVGICGGLAAITGGADAVTCPGLVVGLGAVGSAAGNKLGGAIANVFGW